MGGVQAVTVSLSGHRSLYAVVAGSGPDIVLIHGGLATHHDWVSGPFARIAELGRTIAIDRPGHGNSKRHRLDLAPAEHAAQLIEGLEMLGVKRAVIVAHSFGARLALSLAALRPDMVAHLVLVGPAAFRELRLLEHTVLAPRAIPVFGPLWSRAANPLLDRGWIEAVHRLMWAPGKPAETWQASYPWETILNPEQMVIQGEDFAELHPLTGTPDIDAKPLDTPATILAGQGDLIVNPRSQAERLAGQMRNAGLELVPGQGHMLHHTRPDVIVEAVRGAVGRMSRLHA